VLRFFVGVSQSTCEENTSRGHDQVLVLAAHLVGALRRHRVDRGAPEPADQVEVVGGKILDDAHVTHAVGKRPDPFGGHQEDLAELSLGHAPAQLDQRRVEALDVADRSLDPGRLAHVDQLPRLGGARRERLLHQQVHTGRREPPDGVEVLLGGDRDDRQVGRIGSEQLSDRGVHVLRVVHRSEAVSLGIHGAGELDAG
jgi:hypothetical protein